MCNCENKERAEAWDAVAAAFEPGWNPRNGGVNGQENAVREIKRLRGMEATANRLLEERNAQNRRANLAEDALQRECKIADALNGKLVETAKLLETERKVSASRFDTCVQLRQQLLDAKAPPVMGGGYGAHTQNVRRAVVRWSRFNSRAAEKGVAEAVHFLLQRMEKLEATTAQVQAQDGAKEACGQYDVTDAQTGRAQGSMTWGELRNQD